MRKIFLTISLFLSLFLCCGCEDDAFILFSRQNPKEGLNKNQIENNFFKEERIYYAVIIPKGVEDDTLRLSLTKKDTKSEFLGLSNYRNKTVKLNKDNYYSDYFVIREEGIFVLQAFELKNLSKPIATGIFRVYAN